MAKPSREKIIAELKALQTRAQGFTQQPFQFWDSPDYDSWRRETCRWLEYAESDGIKSCLVRFLNAAKGYPNWNLLDESFLQQGWVRALRGVDDILRHAIEDLEEGWMVAKAEQSVARPRVDVNNRRVFVVHGHDEAAREAVARFIERIEFEAIILHERASKGRPIITKLREEAAEIGFAVVLMTPDDQGGKAGGTDPKLRARQNVVFELGFFIGVLGPERVAALVKGDLERPSNFDGVVYIDLDDAGAWKQKLGKELEAVGFRVDWNKAML